VGRQAGAGAGAGGLSLGSDSLSWSQGSGFWLEYAMASVSTISLVSGTALFSQLIVLSRIFYPMKMTVDLVLIIGMALCYAVGQFVAAHTFSGIAMALLLVFAIRLIGSVISWMVTGR
jgi:hypothetical protein